MKILVSLSNDRLPDSRRSDYVSDECNRHVLRSIGGIFVLFPGMRSWMRGVDYTLSTTSSVDPFDRKLVLSTNGLSGTVEEANRIIAQSNKPGFCVFQERGLDALVVHEMAHAIDHWIRYEHRDDDDALTVYQNGKHVILKKLGPPSEYARKNKQEQFAEQFTLEYLGKGERTLLNYLLGWRDRTR